MDKRTIFRKAYLPRPTLLLLGRSLSLILLIICLGNVLTSCEQVPFSSSSASSFAKELVFYDWVDDMPQSVLDAFQQEYGIKIAYLTYDSQEEAIQNLQAGKIYDVVVMGNEHIPPLAAQGMLAELSYQNITNFKNISPNFRDLIYDPGNKHAVPFNWGTTGLIVRKDLVPQPVMRWADLWDPHYSGRIVMWNISRNVIGLALKSLGYSANSEKNSELEEALQRLLLLKSKMFFMQDADNSIAPYLLNGEAGMGMGFAGDLLRAQEKNSNVVYILPEEGTLLWGDNFVIPANSPHKATAELFLNFLLRPEISAKIIDENFYALPNEAAYPLIKPKILNDPAIFPPAKALEKGEIILALSPEGQALYNKIWRQFLQAKP